MTFIYPRKRNKYGNTPCYALGIKFRSKRERDYAIKLEALKQEGKIKSWQYECKFELWCGNPEAGLEVVCIHKPDFFVITKDEEHEVHEVKQPYTMTALWKLKKKIFEANYPQIKYRVIEK